MLQKYKYMKKVFLLPLILLTISFQCKKESSSTSQSVTGRLVFISKPLFLNNTENELTLLKFNVGTNSDPVNLKKITFQFADNSQLAAISSISADYSGSEPGISSPIVFGQAKEISNNTGINGQQILKTGTHVFRIKFVGNSAADISSRFAIKSVILEFENGSPIKVTPEKEYTFHVAKELRAAGQNNCNTYRIPGLITTNKGTLIAVYDNRYFNSGDLQGDIDVGMSRSANGGNTWKEMKVIMDMGEWGNKPNTENGIGDPSILFDPVTNTIWVAALWYHGNPGKSAWGNSKPGIEPIETGQFVLVKSTDDGLTWSAPINITSQVKKPEWYLFFQGPGNGISLKDGTIVFPAQYKDAAQVPHSTLIYSKDHGLTWTSGTGAKPNTTEAQIVQLANGSLMLNMRDDLNRTEKGPANGRAVSVTTDFGKTWTKHPSSNSLLQEPNCMASLISTQLLVKGKMEQVLFFSNPNDKFTRNHLTIKASVDQGNTWPVEYQLEIYSPEGYGYSCMSMIDQQTIGIVYEGTKNLIFQKIDVSSIIK